MGDYTAMIAHTYTITIIVENAERQGFASEHGLSMWIETPQGNILFDTGQGDALLPNATAMGIDLSLANYIVLSHGHYDHTGAIDQVLALNTKAMLVHHPEVFRTRYSIPSGEAARDISMKQRMSVAIHDLPPQRICSSRTSVELVPGVGTTGEIPRSNDYEDVGGPFFLDKAATRHDTVPDDQSLWFRTDEGLVIICGCAHAGIINTVHQARRASGEHRIAGLIGGFHLKSASERRLSETAKALMDWNVRFVHPCHCSGEVATSYLVSSLGDRVTQTGIGDILKF